MDEQTDRYPWVAMGVVLLGTFMVILDTTIVNVALPQIGVALGRGDGIEWVVTAYLLAVGVAQPPTGWLADRYGRKAIFIGSLILFTIGSLGAALSPNLELLVLARVVQGLGGGALMPVGMAIIYELFPPERRGTALGVWGVAAMAGPAFGPVIGGYLVTTVSWHWLFLINIPVGAVALVAAQRLLRDGGYRERRRFDATGLGLATGGLVLGLLGLAQASDWGWRSPATVGLLVGSVALLTAFVLWERHVAHPAIDVRIFKVPIFSLTLVMIGTASFVQYGILVFLPLTLETVRELSALRVGVLLVPMAIGGAIAFPIGGRLTDRIGPRVPVFAGLTLLAASGFLLANLTVTSELWIISAAVFLQGLGFGFGMMPNSVAGMNALPARYVAQATTVRQLNVRVIASFGVAVLATVVASRLGEVSAAGSDAASKQLAESAYNTVFLISAYVAVGGMALSLFLPGKTRHDELIAERSAELRDIADQEQLDAELAYEAG